MTLTVVPLLVGTAPDERIALTGDLLPFFIFVVLGGRQPVVVDTGTPGREEVKWRNGMRLVRDEAQEPLATLQAIDVDPSEVELVVQTHLHWDHCGNGALFPNAEFLVQKEELRYAVAPAEGDLELFNANGKGLPKWFDIFDQMTVIEGDRKLGDGMSVVWLPGHTPGSQGLLVGTPTGTVLIAGDTVPTYAHWRGDESRRHIPNDLAVDLDAYARTYDRIDGLGCEVVPSHDLGVLLPGGAGP